MTAQLRPGQAYPSSILIRNVVLTDQQDLEHEVVISLVIRDGRLDLVTEDEVAIDTVDIALDAQHDVLIGRLEVGKPPNFIILDGNPRDDFQVLLDTATHARFAIRAGKIERNRLPLATEPGRRPKRSGWLAYSPPPLALATSYQDTSKFNRWETRYLSGLFFAGLLLDRQKWVSQDAASTRQVGDLASFDGGRIRALRFGAVGTLNFPQPWVYTVFAATNTFDRDFDSSTTDPLTFFDWRIDIPVARRATLSIGKQKEPISLERVTGLVYLPMQERSAAADAMLPARNVGLLLSGTAFGQRMSWAGGIFNDWIDTGGSFSDGAIQYIGRVTGLPFVVEDTSSLVHLGVGVRYTDAKEGLRYATESESIAAPLFVDTGLIDADNALTWDFEAGFRRGQYSVVAEYILNDVSAPRFGNPDFTGMYVTGSWVLTGEMRTYNRRSGIFERLPVARSVYQGGWGAWELAARWSDLDLSDGLVEGGQMQITSLGLNWWLTPFFNVSANYRWVVLERFDESGDSSGLNLRVGLLLE